MREHQAAPPHPTSRVQRRSAVWPAKRLACLHWRRKRRKFALDISRYGGHDHIRMITVEIGMEALLHAILLQLVVLIRLDAVTRQATLGACKRASRRAR